ncbi:MAG: preprotein translocase subunit SecA [Minisyncoccia bacterium]
MLSFLYRDPIKKNQPLIKKINSLELEIQKLSDEDLLKKSQDLKKKVQEGEKLDNILPLAFSLVREASKRTLKQRHFDVQLLGGIVLHQGKIAEMKTGEGKTLAATLPAYLNSLTGDGVHIVTVNDYLAKRDTVWMGQIYNFLGISVACILHDQSFIYDPLYSLKTQKDLEILDQTRDTIGSFNVVSEFLRPVSRKEAYQADIVYGTNHEFGFDYLKDNLVYRSSDKVQRGHNYAIIDEVDSILIDEARTPLIIAAPDNESVEFYKIFSKIVANLNKNEDYTVDEKRKTVNITDQGIDKVEKMINVKNIFALENSKLIHYLNESLKAKELFHRDKEYVVKNNEVIIVDEFTGRMLFGRRYSGGLHQAIEAKENVPIQKENKVYAQITIQNYFRMYKKIAGMTGTAQTSAEEFHKVYNLDVITIPTNKPMIRLDLNDLIFKTKEAKYKAVVQEVKKRYKIGQPVLIGTTSIQNNEIISEYLKMEGIPHQVLNAKNHELEGAIIAQAGKLKAVTVATNMAGRGVDIILGGNPPDKEEAEAIKKIGGLHIIGTEKHEAQRIDNQLRGRAGRQGDPGSSQFFLSLEDDLIRIFGGDKIRSLMEKLNISDDIPIDSPIINKLIHQAQLKVEGINFDLRKHLLDFDDILNKQRLAIYKKRETILQAAEQNKIQNILQDLQVNFEKENNNENQNENVNNISDKKQFTIPEQLTPEQSLIIGQNLLAILDNLWINHLEKLDNILEAVNIRAYAQHEPLVEYRKEAFILYQDLNKNFYNIAIQVLPSLLTQKEIPVINLNKSVSQKNDGGNKKIGRNDPCWCGSGKKFKKCHGAS